MSWARHPQDGTRIYYQAQGSGSPLVLIMGLGGSLTAWGMQWSAFSRHHRVVALDNRGAGRSDKSQQGYDSATMADDVLAVMDTEGIDQATVLGVSLGGLIAQSLYHRAPNRVASLILAATGAPYGSGNHVPPDAAVIEALSRDRHTTPRRTLIEAMVPVLYHPTYRERIPNLVDWLVRFEQDEGQPAHAYHGQLGAVLGDRSTPDAPESITAPTLVIHGRDDRVWPLFNAESLAQRLPYGQLRILDGAGHMLMIEQPRRFNAAVLEFTATGKGSFQ